MPWAAAAAVAAAAIGAESSSESSRRAAHTAADAQSANSYQSEIAQDQWDTYKQTYQPLEQKMVADAQNYDTPERREQAAGDASATVAEQYGKARDQLSRTPGLDPSSPAYAASMAGLDASQAAKDATSQNAARLGVQNMAWARQMDALGLGKGLVANASNGMAAASQGALALAGYNQRNANSTASGVGTMVGNVLGSKGFQDWLSSPTPTPTPTPTPATNDELFANATYEA